MKPYVSLVAIACILAATQFGCALGAIPRGSRVVFSGRTFDETTAPLVGVAISQLVDGQEHLLGVSDANGEFEVYPKVKWTRLQRSEKDGVDSFSASATLTFKLPGYSAGPRIVTYVGIAKPGVYRVPDIQGGMVKVTK